MPPPFVDRVVLNWCPLQVSKKTNSSTMCPKERTSSLVSVLQKPMTALSGWMAALLITVGGKTENLTAIVE